MRDPKHASGAIWLVLSSGLLLIGSVSLLIEERRAYAPGALPYVLGVAALLFCIFGDRHAEQVQARRRAWRPR